VLDYPSGTHAQFLPLFSNAIARIINNIYCWLTNIEQPAPIPPKKYVKRIVHTDIQGSDFEGKVNLFPMVAN
jgi:hypothetical protein